MRDAEQAIEKALAGLRTVDAPHGMEGRILRTIEARAAEQDLVPLWRFWMKSPKYAWFAGSGMTIAGVSLATLFMPLMHKPPLLISPDDRPRGAAIRRLVIESTDEGGIPDWSGINNPWRCGLPITAFANKANRPNSADLSLAPDAKSHAAESAETLPTDPEELAMAEMLAPSKPAPPLLLTHQEKLLARVVHKGEPEALTALRPDMRTKEMEISKAEFKDFFNPRPLKDNE